jgi:hypothetical protein
VTTSRAWWDRDAELPPVTDDVNQGLHETPSDVLDTNVSAREVETPVAPTWFDTIAKMVTTHGDLSSIEWPDGVEVQPRQ